MTNPRPRLLFSLILLLPTSLFAQSETLYFEEYGIKDGLPNAHVRSIIQDEQGFIWFTTINGLVRYDGYEFETFGINHQEAAEGSLQLANTGVNIVKGRNGRYWIGGEALGGSSGLAMYDAETHRFKNRLYERADSALVEYPTYWPLFEDSRDNVWFINFTAGYDSNRLGRLHVESDSFFYYPAVNDNTIITLLWPNSGISNYLLYESPGNQKLWSIWQERGVLYQWNPLADTFDIVLEPGDPSLAQNDKLKIMSPMQDDGVILVSDHSIYIWNSEAEKIEQSYHSGASDKNRLLDSPIAMAFQDPFGQIWVGHHGQGFSIINPASGTVERLVYGEGKLSGDRWPKRGQTSIPRIVDSKGIWFSNLPSSTHLYYNHQDQDFNWFDRTFNSRSKRMPRIDRRFTSYLKDDTGLLWLGFSPNLFKENPMYRKYEFFPAADSLATGLPNQNIRSFLEAQLGQYQLATADQNIGSFLEDQSGQFWVATADGLRIFNPSLKRFQFQQSLNTLKGKATTRLMEDADGQIWIGTWSSGVYRFSPPSKTLEHMYEGDNVINQIFQDKSGAIWLGTFIKGSVGSTILKIDQRDGTILEEYTSKSFIKDFYCDRQGNTWMFGNYAYHNPVLYRKPKDGSEFIPYVFDPNDATSINLYNVRFLREDSQGRIWIGTDLGLCQYNATTDNFTRYRSDAGLESGVYAFAEDTSGQIWLGTSAGAGLGLLDTSQNQLIMFGEKEGLLHNDINGFWFDNGKMLYYRDRLWIPGPRGLSIFNTRTQTLDNYTDVHFEPHGGNVAAQSYQTIDHSMWFATKDGLYRIYPDEILKKDSIPPRTWITSMTINGVPYTSADGHLFQVAVSHTRSLELPYWQNDLSFEFVALHYLDPAKNQYSWMMEGLEKSWTDPSTDRKARYSGLNPGTYTFYVKGSNADGIWNKAGARIEITILPPWWKTIWAYTIYVLLVFGIILGIFWFVLNRRMFKVEAQRLRELDQVKTRLYTNITHEFRTPLTIISGMTEQVRENPKNKNRLHEGLDMIKRNSDKLLNLVNQILDLRKMESGKMSATFQQGNMIVFLKYLLDSFEAYATSKNIRLHFISDLDSFIMDFDSDKTLKIVSNLLSNAIKFTKADGDVYVTVQGGRDTVQGERGDAAYATLVLQVRDTGIGISEHQLPHIFDRFYQADDRPIRQAEGTGIGLALSRELVKSLSGEIIVKSRLGEGTTATVILPVSRQAPLMESSLSDQEQISGFMAGETPPVAKAVGRASFNEELPQILIVEDNKDVVHYIRACLERDYRLEVATDGREGIDMALDIIPDLIISDVMMPEVDGYTLCKTLKEDERSSHIPIILLTAKADHLSKIEGLQKGAEAYLSKPFKQDELLIRLQQLIALRRRLQAKYNGATFEVDAATRQEDEFVLNVRQLILEQLDDGDFGIPQLSRALHINRVHLHRKIKALTGKTAAHFIRHIRLQEGRRLLLHTDLNISEIAYDVGFKDPAYFTRVFTESFGESPSAMRNHTS